MINWHEYQSFATDMNMYLQQLFEFKWYKRSNIISKHNQYICNLLSCSDNAVYHGRRNLLEAEIKKGPHSKPNLGRNTAKETFPELDGVFLKVLKGHTVGGDG